MSEAKVAVDKPVEDGEHALLLGGSFLVNCMRGRVATRFHASHTLET
jgi:hypothetical protein